MFHPTSLIWHMFLLQPASLTWLLCHPLLIFLKTLLLIVLQILIMMMRILLGLFLHQLHLLRLLHNFLDGSTLLEKLLMILLVILKISIRHILSSREPLLYWLKFHKIMILTHLQKPRSIHNGTQ